MRVAVIDIDGTLVDSNHLHVLSWQRAFRAAGVEVPSWRILAHVGMGGDHLVAALAGDGVEREAGDRIRTVEGEQYSRLIADARPLPGARELLRALGEQGMSPVLASSAKPEEMDRYLDMLDARELVRDWVSARDVSTTKPAPDLLEAALDRAGAQPGHAVMVGDTAWDVRAARNAGMPCVGVTSGGIARQELLDAGAVAVYQDAEELCVAVGRGQFDSFGAARQRAGNGAEWQTASN